jgi:hypothetical protein
VCRHISTGLYGWKKLGRAVAMRMEYGESIKAEIKTSQRITGKES